MNNTKLVAWLIRVLPFTCPWWHIWNPGSGVVGGLVNSVLLSLLLLGGHHWIAVAFAIVLFAIVAAKTWLIAKRKYWPTP